MTLDVIITNKYLIKEFYMKNLYFLTLCVLTSYLFSPNLYAYIDPGSGGAIITAILGFFAAIGYTIRKYFYKIRNLFSKKKD